MRTSTHVTDGTCRLIIEKNRARTTCDTFGAKNGECWGASWWICKDFRGAYIFIFALLLGATTSKVGVIPSGLGIMGRLGRGGLTHVIQRIKIQIGTHVINRSVVVGLNGKTHRMPHIHPHAHGRRRGRRWWAAMLV